MARRFLPLTTWLATYPVYDTSGNFLQYEHSTVYGDTANLARQSAARRFSVPEIDISISAV